MPEGDDLGLRFVTRLVTRHFVASLILMLLGMMGHGLESYIAEWGFLLINLPGVFAAHRLVTYRVDFSRVEHLVFSVVMMGATEVLLVIPVAMLLAMTRPWWSARDKRATAGNHGQ
jgi:hypothetical protein